MGPPKPSYRVPSRESVIVPSLVIDRGVQTILAIAHKIRTKMESLTRQTLQHLLRSEHVHLEYRFHDLAQLLVEAEREARAESGALPSIFPPWLVHLDSDGVELLLDSRRRWSEDDVLFALVSAWIELELHLLLRNFPHVDGEDLIVHHLSEIGAELALGPTLPIVPPNPERPISVPRMMDELRANDDGWEMAVRTIKESGRTLQQRRPLRVPIPLQATDVVLQCRLGPSENCLGKIRFGNTVYRYWAYNQTLEKLGVSETRILFREVPQRCNSATSDSARA